MCRAEHSGYVSELCLTKPLLVVVVALSLCLNSLFNQASTLRATEHEKLCLTSFEMAEIHSLLASCVNLRNKLEGTEG